MAQLIGNKLVAQGVGKGVLSDLHEFGLSYQRDSISKHQRYVVANQLEKGFNFKGGRYTYCILYYDNIGFKHRCGEWGPGYDQFTKVIHVVIDEEKLIKIRIYSDPNNPDSHQPLSCDEKVWDNEKKQTNCKLWY